MAEQIEIECKYRVAAGEVPALKEMLRAQCRQCRSFEKRDVYYVLVIGGIEKLLRVRRTGETCVLTYKEKHMRRGVEENREYEVAIVGEEGMHAMLRALGATTYLTKKKRGDAYELPANLYGNPVTVELVEVPPLGYFVEIECLASPREENLEHLHATLARVASAYQLLPRALEPRLYIDLLKET